MTDHGATRLDMICRRQTARFLDHLRDTGQHNERLERDVLRLMRYVFSDIKEALGLSTEATNGQAK